MKTVLYWSPCLTKIGTIKSTINSAISLAKYSNNKYKVKIINSCGEWDEYTDIIKENNLDLINFRYKLFQYLPKNGFWKSRFSYLVIILFSFFPLIKILKKEKPDFMIIHLITSLPLILNNLFNFDTKFILRISGFPKLNFFRKFLWEKSSKKLYKITCPTKDLYNDLSKRNIFDKNKVFYLQDAIINIKDYIKKKKSSSLETKDKQYQSFFLSVGRLTKQKNYSYLIKEFSNYVKENNDAKLLIVGDGEEKYHLDLLIKEKKLSNNIFLIGEIKNVYPFMKKARALILSSLWEEVGFVIVESAFSNLFVISSDCPNGPTEFLENGEAGYLFQSNKENELKNKLLHFTAQEKNVEKLKVKAKKNSLNFSLFRHYLNLEKILNNKV